MRPLYGRARVAIDWLSALLFLVVASPGLALIALIIKLESRGPAFYTQIRTGRGCRTFRIVKFRTMVHRADALLPLAANEMRGCMFKLTHDPRVTPFGRFLRRWSLDELPQLWNVLTGDMALIGPRPLEPFDTALIPTDYLDRFALRPGITGLWQATRRDCRDGFLKVALDADYVRRRCLKLDLWLAWRTVLTVATGRGAC